MGANHSTRRETEAATQPAEPLTSRTACPLCGAVSYLAFVQQGYPIRDCAGCRHRFAGFLPVASHVSETYGDDYFLGGGAGYPDYLSEGKLLTETGRRYGRLLGRFRSPRLLARSASEGTRSRQRGWYFPQTSAAESVTLDQCRSEPSLALRANKSAGRLLDVGAAAGFVLDGYCQTGWQGEGVEPNRRMAEYAARELGRTVHCGTLEELSSPPPWSGRSPRAQRVAGGGDGADTPPHDSLRESTSPAGGEVKRRHPRLLAGLFDAVSFIQVVAHLPEPMETFRAADAVTKPGGLWLVETWNAASRTARLLGPAWHEYSPPSVLHWWTPAVLKRTLEPMGYRLRGTGFAQKWIGVGHAQSLLRHKYGNGLPTRLASLLPGAWKLPYPSEDLFWAVYQKGIG